VLTGKYPARLNMTIWHEASQHPPLDRKLLPPVTVGNLPQAELTLAEKFQQAGYLTAHVGKWHLGKSAYYPENHGFDVNIGGTFWGAPQTYYYPYRGTEHFGGERRYVPDLPWGERGKYLTDHLTDKALEVIERAKDRPFFLHLAYHSVHTPIEAKPDLVEKYRQKMKPGFNHQNVELAAMVHSLDRNVGRVLAKLDQLGIREDTVVIFTSDNGGFINEYEGQTVTTNAPLRSGKGSLYEGGVRVPLVIQWPGVTPGDTVCHEPVISIDLYPSVLEIAGFAVAAEHKKRIDGVSMVPLLRNPSTELDRKHLYFHYPHYYRTTSPVSAVRGEDWKLLEYFEDGRMELYNLREDPSENHDLTESMPDKVDELKGLLQAWREEVDAQVPKKNPESTR